MRRWIVIVLAFLAGAGVGAGVLLSRLASYPSGALHWRHSGPEYFPPLPVIVAVEDLPAGTVLTKERLSQRGLPEQFIYEGMVQPAQVSTLIGLAIRKPLMAGEPVLASSVVHPGSVEDLCGQLAEAAHAHKDEVARAKLEALRARLASP